MKYLKRLLSIALAAAFMLSFAACGGDVDTSETVTTVATITETQQSEADTQANTDSTVTKTVATTKATAVNNAATITDNSRYSAIAGLITRTTNKKGNATASFINSLKGYTLNIMQAWEPTKSGTTAESTKWCKKQVEEMYGVTINVDGFFSQYNETLTANLSARRAQAQIYMVQDFNFASYFKNNYLSDLTNGMNISGVDFKDPWYNQNARAFTNINYKQYGWIAYGVEYTFPYGIMYNRNILSKKKLTDPADLVEQGKWTWATLENYAKKLDSNSVVGFGAINPTLMLASMTAAKGVPVVKVKKGSSPETNMENQAIKDCLTQLGKWCKDGGICDTFSGLDWTGPKTQFSAGKVAMLYCSHDAIKNTLSNKSFEDEIGFVPFPTQTETKKFTNVSIPQFTWFIPSQHQNDVAKILFIRNEMYRQEYRFSQRNFQIQWEQYFDDPDMVDLVCNLMYGRGNFTTTYDWRSVCEKSGAKVSSATIVSYVIKNGGAVQTAIDTNIKALKTEYTDMWNGYKITGDV